MELLRRGVEAFAIPPGRIAIEVPVDMVPDDPATRRKAAQLREIGVNLALSDFTDTTASLRALAHLQPDVVTLDARHLGHASRGADTAARLQAACCRARAAGALVCAKGWKPARNWKPYGAGAAMPCRATCWRSRFPRIGCRRRTVRLPNARGCCCSARIDRRPRAARAPDHWHASCNTDHGTPRLCPLLTIPERSLPMKKGWIWCLLAATLLAGCNTMAGVGQDVQKGGQKLENSAERAK